MWVLLCKAAYYNGVIIQVLAALILITFLTNETGRAVNYDPEAWFTTTHKITEIECCLPAGISLAQTWLLHAFGD